MTNHTRSKPMLIIAVAVAVGIVGFLGANLHLAYVAMTTQPDCVPHAKAPVSTPGVYRAAKSSC